MRKLLYALIAVAGLAVGAAAQQSNVTNAVVIAALQAMGLFGDGYATGQVPIWNATTGQYAAGAPVPGYPATCAAAGTGLGVTATPTWLLCVSGTAILTGSATAVTSTVPFTITAPNTASDFVALAITQNDTGNYALTTTGVLGAQLTATGDDALIAIRSALGTTSTNGISLRNNTAATGGATVQISPRLLFRGNAWNTTASQTVDWFIENLPATAATPTGTMKFGYSLNGAAATYPMTINSVGTANLAGYLNTFALAFYAQGFLDYNTNAKWIFHNNADTAGIGIDFTTDSLLLFRTRAHTGAGGIGFASLAVSGTAPSAPVACTSPAVTWSNGTAVFQIDVGTTCAAVTTLAVTMPAAANAWQCAATNTTTSATAAIEMTASTTTSATFTNYTRTTGLALVFVDGADIRIMCFGG